MGGSDGTRAVSEVMGAILVFSLLVTTLGAYQAVIVPNENQEIEFKHNAEVRGDMQSLWSGVRETGRTGERRAVEIDTGVQYPSRSLTINPGEPVGSVRTSDLHSDAVEIQGAEAVDAEEADFWASGTTHGFDTRFVLFEPGYNYYQEAPTTIYEPTVLYSSADGGDVVDAPQRLIDDRTINLVVVDGELARANSRGVNLDLVPVSTSSRTVEVTGPITLMVKTNLAEAQWQQHLDDFGHASLNDYDDSTTPHTATIELAAGPYELNLAKVGIDDALSEPAARYVVNTDSTSRTLNPGESADLTVRVLDRFGNPVSGETVRCCGGTGTEQTDEDGYATFSVASGSAGTISTVNVWFDGSTASSVGNEKKVEYTISSSSPSTGSPSANLINPGSGLVFESATTGGVLGSDEIAVRFRNTNSSPNWENVTRLRVNYYYTSPPGSGPSLNREAEQFETNRTASTGDVGGPYVFTDGSFNVSASDTIGVKFDFDYSGTGGGTLDLDEGDYFFVSLVFEDGSSRIYVVAPQS